MGWYRERTKPYERYTITVRDEPVEGNVKEITITDNVTGRVQVGLMPMYLAHPIPPAAILEHYFGVFAEMFEDVLEAEAGTYVGWATLKDLNSHWEEEIGHSWPWPEEK